MSSDDSSVLDKLDSAVPAPLANFDAFPKIPSTYKSRSESRGFMTLFVAFLALLLMLNDISEYVWGWPDQEFSIDKNKSSYLAINVDVSVNMPCRFLSVDLRDAVGDRLFLSGGLRRDGTNFDTTQAQQFKAHSESLSVRQVVSQSRKSRGLFSIFRRAVPSFRPTYTHEAAADACRIWGTLLVKRVTANLHITTLGHGYASYEHVDHSQMNLSHVISEFSFGPYFPDITQPLDHSFEVTHEPLLAYQYFLHVVPTTYIAPRSNPVDTNQYSVTHYTRVVEHNRGTPGIFFKFDLDPLHLTIHQRTPSLIQLIIRCVGVIGGVFVCMGYAIRITTRAVEVVSGADSAPGIVAAEASGVKVGLRAKWGGSELRARTGKMVRQGNGWVLEGGDSPYQSYAGTPVSSNGFTSPGGGGGVLSPASVPLPATPGIGLGPPPPSSPYSAASSHNNNNSNSARPLSGLNPSWTPRTPSLNSGQQPSPQQMLSPGGGGPPLPPPSTSVPNTPSAAYATFPPTPNSNGGNGFQVGPPPRRTPSLTKKDD